MNKKEFNSLVNGSVIVSNKYNKAYIVDEVNEEHVIVYDFGYNTLPNEFKVSSVLKNYKLMSDEEAEELRCLIQYIESNVDVCQGKTVELISKSDGAVTKIEVYDTGRTGIVGKVPVIINGEIQYMERYFLDYGYLHQYELLDDWAERENKEMEEKLKRLEHIETVFKTLIEAEGLVVKEDFSIFDILQ